MATDPKTGQIINDDKSAESIRADRSVELSNPGDEGPKVPKDAVADKLRQQQTVPVAESGNQPAPQSVIPGKEDDSKDEKEK